VAENADFFLQLKPGTEPVLYGGMAKVIVDRGLMNLPFILRNASSTREVVSKGLSA
jgi:predicted molibdopterin-dependent oxidoreductase YjgC